MSTMKVLCFYWMCRFTVASYGGCYDGRPHLLPFFR